MSPKIQIEESYIGYKIKYIWEPPIYIIRNKHTEMPSNGRHIFYINK